MSRRGRRTLGVPTFPMPLSGRFMPAIILIVLGLGLLMYKTLTQEVRHEQDLAAREGTLTNYSFKKTPEGEPDYGIWLKEFSERFELLSGQEATFDTTAFKAALKPRALELFDVIGEEGTGRYEIDKAVRKIKYDNGED